ncbi:MAG TPA: hypothetical protein VF183_11550 [Acidimicrobiales bacterium]
MLPIPRMNPRRALATGAVAALSIMGISSALWTDRVNVNSTVDTGNLTVTLQADRAYSNARQPSQENPYADCDIAVLPDGKTIQVTVTDAYPGMWCRAWFKIKNEGTVAARISDFTETGNLPLVDMNPDYQLIGTVIEPGQSISRAFDINIPSTANEQTLNENAVYTYSQTFSFENVAL